MLHLENKNRVVEERQIIIFALKSFITNKMSGGGDGVPKGYSAVHVFTCAFTYTYMYVVQ